MNCQTNQLIPIAPSALPVQVYLVINQFIKQVSNDYFQYVKIAKLESKTKLAGRWLHWGKIFLKIFPQCKVQGSRGYK